MYIYLLYIYIHELNVTWNGTGLDNASTPVYRGVHLDRTLSYKTHICNTNQKVNARNNIIRKLANSKCGNKAQTPRTSGLSLCYFAAEFACVWTRSTHGNKRNPALHDCCRIITSCLKLTNIDSLHLLTDIAPPDIRRTAASRTERSRQAADTKPITVTERFPELHKTAELIACQHQTGNVGNTTARNISSRKNGIATS